MKKEVYIASVSSVFRDEKTSVKALCVYLNVLFFPWVVYYRLMTSVFSGLDVLLPADIGLMRERCSDFVRRDYNLLAKMVYLDIRGGSIQEICLMPGKFLARG